MPTYEYRCRTCEHRFDIQQSISDDTLTVCPECAGDLRKVFHPVGIAFKGQGFYKNDARSDSGGASGSSSASGSTGETTSSSDGGSSTGDSDKGGSASSSDSNGSKSDKSGNSEKSDKSAKSKESKKKAPSSSPG
jgi:putative FmdB family regulatory protein